MSEKKCVKGEYADDVHPLFEEVDGYSPVDHIPPDSLHLLADLDLPERISAVEKAICRRLDPTKDGELVHWFRLLKRVYALGIIGSSQMGAGPAEEDLQRDSPSIGPIYRGDLKSLYTQLPDAKEEGKNVIPVYALPETKAWILAEIANGWSPHNHTETDRMDCLLFLSATTGELRGNPYQKDFYRIRRWDETQKCVRDLLRARFKDFSPGSKFSDKEIVEYLKQPTMLSATIVSTLWHGLIADMAEYDSSRGKLRDMLNAVDWS